MFLRRWEILVTNAYRNDWQTPASGRILCFTRAGAESTIHNIMRWHYIMDGNRYGIQYKVIKREN